MKDPNDYRMTDKEKEATRPTKTINIVDAEELLDNDMTKDEVDFLLAAREGVPLYDVPEKTMARMQELNLVDIIPFDHPRAHNSIRGVVPSENGVKVLNLIDNRKWARADYSLASEPALPSSDSDYVEKAQDTTMKDNASEAGAISADAPIHKLHPTSQEEREDQEAKFELGKKSAKAKDLDKNYDGNQRPKDNDKA